MSMGLRIWDALGNLTLDTSDAIGRLLGTADSPSIAGSGSAVVSVPGMAADGTWLVAQLTMGSSASAVVGSGGFTVYSSYLATPAMSWAIIKKDGVPSLAGMGLAVMNEGGGVQIDQDYKNYVRLGSGTGVASGSQVSLVYGATIYGVRPSAASGAAINFAAADASSFAAVCTSGTWDWVAYGPIQDALIGGFGLKVMTADGHVAFDSGQAYFRPVNVISLSTDGLAHNFTLPTPPAGMRPYCSLFNLVIVATAVNLSNPNIGYTVGPRITFNSATSLTGQCTYIAGGPPFDSGPWTASRQILVMTDY